MPVSDCEFFAVVDGKTDSYPEATMPTNAVKPGDVTVTLVKRHPGQQAIADHPARFKVVMSGRRYGKTALGIREVQDAALAGWPVGWFAPTYRYALEVWRELVDRLRPVTARSNDQERRIELVTGGVIEVWTLDGPDPGLGRKYALVVIDEAGIVPELLLIWQQAIRPTLVDLRGRAWFLGTPRGRRHGFVTLFAKGNDPAEPEWASFRARTLDNPYIPAEEVEAARRELPPEVFAQEFEAIPMDDGVNPFGLDAIRSAEARYGDGTPGPAVVYGVDVARAVDYTVVCGLDAYRRVVVLERWQAPWAETKDRIARLVGQTPVVADATGVGDAIVADLESRGVLVTPHVFTQQSKLRLMQRLIAAFQGGELAVPSGWLIAELEAFEFTFTNTGVKYEAPRGLHDDGVMALGLALYGWDRVQMVAPEAPVGMVERGDDPYVGDEIDGRWSPGDIWAQLPVGW